MGINSESVMYCKLRKIVVRPMVLLIPRNQRRVDAGAKSVRSSSGDRTVSHRRQVAARTDCYGISGIGRVMEWEMPLWRK